MVLRCKIKVLAGLTRSGTAVGERRERSGARRSSADAPKLTPRAPKLRPSASKLAPSASVKAPAVFFSVYINFPREPEPLGVAVTIAPTSLEGKLCRALGFFPDSAPWSPPVPLPALEVCVAIKHFFSMASTASMRFHNNKQAIEGLIAQGCANMHEYFGANGYNQLLSDITAKRGDTQDWLPFLASANLTLAADEDDTDVPERRYVLAGLNGALALARASAARADLYTAAALADPKTASGAGATAPVPRTRTSTCTSTRAAASAPARQATEDASTAPQFGEVLLGDATAEPSGPAAASSTTTPPRQRADGADRANGGALEASPTSVIDGPNVTRAVPAAEPPATDGTLVPGAPQLPAFARCARRDCACHFEGASFNGLPGHFCCRTCQRGTPCTFAWHTTPFQFDYIDPAAGAEAAPDGAPTSDTTDAADAGALAARASALLRKACAFSRSSSGSTSVKLAATCCSWFVVASRPLRRIHMCVVRRKLGVNSISVPDATPTTVLTASLMGVDTLASNSST